MRTENMQEVQRVHIRKDNERSQRDPFHRVLTTKTKHAMKKNWKKILEVAIKILTYIAAAVGGATIS